MNPITAENAKSLLTLFLVDLLPGDDDPSSALLKEDYPDFVALMERGICDIATRWNATLRAVSPKAADLYHAAAPVIRDIQTAVREFVLTEPPAVVIQASLQMWTSFLFTVCSLRSAVMPQVEDGEMAAAAVSIDVAPRQGGVLSLPDGVTPPALFKSIQGRGVAAPRLAALSRGDGSTQRRLKRECRTDVAKQVLGLDDAIVERPRSRKLSVAAKPHRNILTYRGLANVLRCDEKRIHAIDEAGMILLRRSALQNA